MRVYYLVAQRPDEVPYVRIFHDLYTPSIQPSVREPFGPSDCVWLVPQTEHLSGSLAQLNWRTAHQHPLLSTSAASVGMTRHDWPLVGF
jgi:hypothetical protein